MKGRRALVTGGTRGIGAAISRAFKAAGVEVVASYHSNHEAARAFAADSGVTTRSWDVADFQASADAIASLEREWGAIDILVNNAGITSDGAFHKMSQQQWRQVISANLDSMFNVTRPLFAAMRERGFGRIINISSVNGQKGQFGQVNYAASKAGIIGFTRALALEGAAKGITVNAVAPGYIETDMTASVPQKIREALVAAIPARRFGSAEEVARCVLYLADDSSAFVNGATLAINGGQYMG